MCEIKNAGYNDVVLRLLQSANCQIGDIIRITCKGKTYEGILIPRAKFGDTTNIIVIKMKNGYNVGIAAFEGVNIEKIGVGTKPMHVTPVLPEQNSVLPHVIIMITDGTIAGHIDYQTGTTTCSTICANDLYGVAPELSEIAKIDAENVFNIYSENVTPKSWTELAKKIAKHIKRGIDGIVITHSTDTMGYTSAALSFALQNLPIPIIFVGAQYSSDRPSSDATTNLIAAVKTAGVAPFAEVGLAMHETISDSAIVVHRGVRARKCHTSRRDAFKSVNDFPIAKVFDQKVVMEKSDYQHRDSSKQLVLKPDFCEKVALVKFYPGVDSSVIDYYVNQGFRGILLEGYGLGNVSATCFEAIKNAIAKGVIVAFASQCIWGRVNMNVNDAGRVLLDLGVVALDDMFPETGLVKLMWVLGHTNDAKEVVQLLKTNIAGEFTVRSLPQEETVYGV